mmetsp:Transcript_2921/g.4738  ORF Transcript_2921/g.4738 Transcript_2921/m.4738 type:complete len:200 (-) Transcript_2921:427-1026(-)
MVRDDQMLHQERLTLHMPLLDMCKSHRRHIREPLVQPRHQQVMAITMHMTHSNSSNNISSSNSTGSRPPQWMPISQRLRGAGWMMILSLLSLGGSTVVVRSTSLEPSTAGADRSQCTDQVTTSPTFTISKEGNTLSSLSWTMNGVLHLINQPLLTLKGGSTILSTSLSSRPILATEISRRKRLQLIMDVTMLFRMVRAT